MIALATDMAAQVTASIVSEEIGELGQNIRDILNLNSVIIT